MESTGKLHEQFLTPLLEPLLYKAKIVEMMVTHQTSHHPIGNLPSLSHPTRICIKRKK
jgi:hypothetical protein